MTEPVTAEDMKHWALVSANGGNWFLVDEETEQDGEHGGALYLTAYTYLERLERRSSGWVGAREVLPIGLWPSRAAVELAVTERIPCGELDDTDRGDLADLVNACEKDLVRIRAERRRGLVTRATA